MNTKKILISAALFCGLCALPNSATAAPVPIDAAHFPDPAFREHLTNPINNIDYNQDGLLSDQEQQRSFMYISYLPISDIKGIEYFPNIQSLSISATNISNLDLSKNHKLIDVNAQYNKNLKSIDIGGKDLSNLDLSHNPLLSKIDLSKMPNLERFGAVDCCSLDYIKLAPKCKPLDPSFYPDFRSVNFETNGGTNLSETYFRCNKSISLDEFVPKKKDAKFAGWYTDSDFITSISDISLKHPGSPATGMKLYAKWISTDSDDDKDENDSTEEFFNDVSQSDYYYEPVQWAVKNDIANGTSPTTFSPKEECTRADAVTFLWNQAGKPEPLQAYKGEDHAMESTYFADVPSNAYYAKAVQWAVEREITSGTSAIEFSPNQTCNRNQIITFMWRAEGKPKVSGKNYFEDVPSNAYYADAVQWAIKNNITNGVGNNQFAPEADCTRGQIVTFLFNNK